MSDFRVLNRNALDELNSGRHGGVTLSPLALGSVIQVMSSHDIPDAEKDLHEIVSHRGWSLRPSGLRQWFVVADKSLANWELDEFFAALPADVDAFDQTHGRVRINIEGRLATEIVASGTALDVMSFDVGSGTTTLFGHIAVHVFRTSEDAFELMVLRGFAESLWDDIVRTATEIA